jgi:hypothetical protein
MRKPEGSRAARALGAAAVAVTLSLAVGASAWAATIAIGPQAMEGDLRVEPGDIVKAGFSFTIPGSHPAENVRFDQAVVTFASVACVTGSGGGSFSVVLGSGGVVGPFAVPADDSEWFPSGDQSSASSYQGSVAVPDLCHGGTMSLRGGAAFSADVLSSDVSHSLNVRFHYSAGGSSGSWSATRSVVPDALDATSVPIGAVGATGLSVAIAIVVVLASVRRRPPARMRR